MPSVNIAPVVRPQFFDNNAAPASGGSLLTYQAGSSTPLATFTDSTGTVANPTTISLNARGEPANAIWLAAGLAYKFVYKDPDGVTVWTEDYVRGVNDTTDSASEWQTSGLTPTYLSASSFSIQGDQTSTFQVGRRVKAATSGGTRYGAITRSTFSAGATTVVVSLDSGALDSGLSSVDYARLSASSPSVPAVLVGSTYRQPADKFRERVSVLDYGAAGDGTTDDTSSLQAALDAAYAQGRPLHWPKGTYYTGTLTYKGQALYGDGKGRTIIKGKAGQDVFYAPDPSTSETGSLTSFPEYMVCRDMTLRVDNSAALSLPSAFNRPLFPATAWAASTAYQEGQWVTNSSGKVYYCFTSGTSSASEPTHTSGIAKDGTVRWVFIESAQIYVGNAAFAFPLASGTDPHSVIFHPEFKNVRIEVTGTQYANSACAIFSQRAFYDARFEDVTPRFTKFGIINVPPTTNYASYEFSPDGCDFSKCDFYNTYPLVIYNPSYATANALQLYSASSGDRGLFLLNYKGLARIAAVGCTFEAYYCEPNSATTVAISHIMGERHIFNGGALKSASGTGYINWLGNACEVNGTYIGNDPSASCLTVIGNRNDFSLRASNLSVATDLGFGNRVTTTILDNVGVFESDRRWFVNAPRAYGNIKTGEFATDGMASVPFVSKTDLFITPGDIAWESPVTAPSITIDSTLESGHYATLPANGGGYFSILNRVQASIGTRFPKSKVRFYVKIRAASGTPTQALTIATGAGGTTRGSGSLPLTTSWQVLSVDADLDAATGGDKVQPTFANTSTNVAVDIAWLAVRPIPVDLVPRVGTNVGDAAATLTVGSSEMTQVWSTALTTDRAVTLSTTGAYNGAKFRVVRTAAATGASNLNVGTGPLKALAAGQWCDVEYSGSAWMLTAYGSL